MSQALELHLGVVLAGVERVEVGNAIDAEHHRLAIEDEMLLPVLQRALDDPREAAGPLMAVPRDRTGE